MLLLFDIVLCIQVENLKAITTSEQTMAAYLQNSFFSAGYLMAASIVALKCLNPCAGLGGMDGAGRRYGILHSKLRRGCGATSQDVNDRSHQLHDEIRDEK